MTRWRVPGVTPWHRRSVIDRHRDQHADDAQPQRDRETVDQPVPRGGTAPVLARVVIALLGGSGEYLSGGLRSQDTVDPCVERLPIHACVDTRPVGVCECDLALGPPGLGDLYRSRLAPRFLSVWGAFAVAAMLAWNVLEAFGVRVPAGRVGRQRVRTRDAT